MGVVLVVAMLMFVRHSDLTGDVQARAAWVRT